MNFEIKLPLFEGPFDLLLFFIERDELDIYDIPISKITNDFLHYLHHLEKLNIDIASEFIVVAATLMRIKAKMLLPRPELDEAGNEIDPREDLVKHLLEYKKYKSVIAEFEQFEADRLKLEARGNIIKEVKKLSEVNNLDAEMQDLDLYKLMKVYIKVMQKFEIASKKPTHTVVAYPYTIEQQKEFIVHQLTVTPKLSFIEIYSFYKEKIALIYNFMAILELLQLNKIKIHVGMGYNNFWILQKEASEVDN